MTTAVADNLVRDQATSLRALAKAGQRRAYTVAITSGKGGVGKTNIAVNLAICLSGRGLRVTLVDLDMGLANADVLLKLRTRYNLSHVISGLRTLEQITTKAPGGVRFVPGGSGLDELANLSEFERQRLNTSLHNLDSNADIVILDCGAGISKNVTTFASAADVTLVVTTPEPTAVTDAYAVIKTMRRRQAPADVRLLVNQVGSRAEARRTYTRLSGVAEKFLHCPVADAGYLLHDAHVQLAVRYRSPFVIRYPRCAASACMAVVAAELARSRFPRQDGGGFLKRVLGLFT